MKRRSARLAVVGLAAAGAMGLLTGPALATGGAKPSGTLTAIPGSLTPTRDAITGTYSSASMSVEVVLAPGHQADLQKLLA